MKRVFGLDDAVQQLIAPPYYVRNVSPLVSRQRTEPFGDGSVLIGTNVYQYLFIDETLALARLGAMSLQP
jgi:hypothetical protein